MMLLSLHDRACNLHFSYNQSLPPLLHSSSSIILILHDSSLHRNLQSIHQGPFHITRPDQVSPYHAIPFQSPSVIPIHSINLPAPSLTYLLAYSAIKTSHIRGHTMTDTAYNKAHHNRATQPTTSTTNNASFTEFATTPLMPNIFSSLVRIRLSTRQPCYSQTNL